MDVFQAAREAVSAEDAGRRYGLEIRRGKACCCFHPDRNPSMSFHNGRFRCWSCGAAGSSIDLTARLLNLSPLEAVKRLDADFCLGLDFGAQTPEEKRYYAFCKWREETLDRLDKAACWCAVRGDRETGAALNAAFTVLVGDDLPEQLSLYRRKERIDTLCRRLETRSMSASGH